MNKTPTYHLENDMETTFLGSENDMETNPQKNGFNFDMNMILQTWIWTILGNVTVSLMEWHSFKRCPITWCWTNIQLQWFICHLWLCIFPMFVRLLSAVVGEKQIYIYTLSFKTLEKRRVSEIPEVLKWNPGFAVLPCYMICKLSIQLWLVAVSAEIFSPPSLLLRLSCSLSDLDPEHLDRWGTK